MDFMKVHPEGTRVFVTGKLTVRMVDGFVYIAPPDESGVNVVFIGVDERCWLHITLNEWLNGLLLHMGSR